MICGVEGFFGGSVCRAGAFSEEPSVAGGVAGFEEDSLWFCVGGGGLEEELRPPSFAKRFARIYSGHQYLVLKLVAVAAAYLVGVRLVGVHIGGLEQVYCSASMWRLCRIELHAGSG